MSLQKALFGIACRMVGDVHKFYVDSENYALVAVFLSRKAVGAKSGK
jgi:hypothetical protein